MLLRELLGKATKAGEVGIEIEVEAAKELPSIDLPLPWKGKADHSLRGKMFNEEARTDPSSMEYVTNGAIPVGGTKKAIIKRLCVLLADAKYEVDADSPRTSVHVHVNVLEMTPLQIWTAVFCYWIAENVFMDYCGPERQGNMYCLRLKDAEGVLVAVEKDLKKPAEPFIKLNTDQIRYCGLNLKAIPTLGSLEFRGMRGTIDADIIDTWSTMVYDVVDKSKRWATPEEALDYFWEQGPNNFLSALTSYTNFATLAKTKDWKDLLTDNASILSDLAYSTDWTRWAKQVEDARKKKYGAYDLWRAQLGQGFVERPQPPQPQVDLPAVNVLLDDNF